MKNTIKTLVTLSIISTSIIPAFASNNSADNDPYDALGQSSYESADIWTTMPNLDDFYQHPIPQSWSLVEYKYHEYQDELTYLDDMPLFEQSIMQIGTPEDTMNETQWNALHSCTIDNEIDAQTLLDEIWYTPYCYTENDATKCISFTLKQDDRMTDDNRFYLREQVSTIWGDTKYNYVSLSLDNYITMIVDYHDFKTRTWLFSPASAEVFRKG